MKLKHTEYYYKILFYGKDKECIFDFGDTVRNGNKEYIVIGYDTEKEEAEEEYEELLKVYYLCIEKDETNEIIKNIIKNIKTNDFEALMNKYNKGHLNNYVRPIEQTKLTFIESCTINIKDYSILLL